MPATTAQRLRARSARLRLRTAARIAAVALAYLTASVYAIELQSFETLDYGYWPAAGIMVAALVYSPRSQWPWLIGTTFATVAVYGLVTGFPLAATALFVVGQAGGQLVAAATIQYLRAQGLDSAGRVLWFGAGAFVGASVGAVFNATGLALTFAGLPFGIVLAKSIAGNTIGILTVAPFALVLLGRTRHGRARHREASVTLLAGIGLIAWAFSTPLPPLGALLAFLAMLLLVWIAIRHKVAGAATIVAALAQIAFVATMTGHGPLAGVAVGLLRPADVLQAFLAVIALTTVMLAARTEEVETLQHHAEDRDALFAVVSHELRTPLTPILGFAETLIQRDRELAPDQRAGMLRAIQRHGEQLTMLVDDLLLLSRSRSQQLTANPALHSVTSLAREFAHGHPHHPVEVRVDGPDPTVWVDRDHLGQILGNLVTNAWKHGRPPVVISASRIGERTRIAVTDHGAGIPDWFVPHLFETFTQASAGDRRTSSGLGLGLAICRNLATINHGELAFDVHYMRGARFVLTLPSTADAARHEEFLHTIGPSALTH